MSTLKSITTAEFLRTGERKNWIDAQIRGDKFTTFVWRGKNSWEDYNCFITSDKRGLTWSNYGSIKNDYSSTMFGVNKTLLGTTVENKSITMNLCLYDVTMALYEEFLVWLNPQILGRLYIGIKPATDYKNSWFYKAKIGSIGDSTINYLGQDRYIIELKVVFETQDNYAYHEEPVRNEGDIVGTWKLKPNNFRSSFNIIVEDAQPDQYVINTYLEKTTIEKTIRTTIEKTIKETKTTTDGGSTTTIEEFIDDKPIVSTLPPVIESGPEEGTNEEIVNIHLTQGTAFEYSSAEGILYKTDTGEPLSLLTSNAGQRVLRSMFVTKKFTPSILDDGAVKIKRETSSPKITEGDPKFERKENAETHEIIETTTTIQTIEVDDKETTIEYNLWITIQNTKGEDNISLVYSDDKSKITIYRQDKCLIPMGQILTNPALGGTDNE